MKNFVGVDEEGYVEVQMSYSGEMAADGMGPPNPTPAGPYQYHEVEALEFLEPRPTKTCRLKWVDGQRTWVEEGSLSTLQADAIAGIDAFADACRMAVVGDAARIKEYERAQLGAEQYRDAGYTGTVPPPVDSWAHAKRREGWTPKQAAEDILAASTRWYAALDGIRAMRLDAKETIRAAATGQEVATTVATFRATLTAAMQGVQ